MSTTEAIQQPTAKSTNLSKYQTSTHTAALRQVLRGGYYKNIRLKAIKGADNRFKDKTTHAASTYYTYLYW